MLQSILGIDELMALARLAFYASVWTLMPISGCHQQNHVSEYSQHDQEQLPLFHLEVEESCRLAGVREILIGLDGGGSRKRLLGHRFLRRRHQRSKELVCGHRPVLRLRHL